MTGRFIVKRTVDSSGAVIANLDSDARGLSIADADTLEEARLLAGEDLARSAKERLPIGEGCYYILDSETREHIGAFCDYDED